MIQLCAKSRPDILFYSNCYGHVCPKWETFGIIKKRLGIPVARICWEANDDTDPGLQYVDLNIVLHSSYMKKTRDLEKFIHMWVPQDPRIYYNPDIKRDIDISFMGSTAERIPGYYVDRRNGINALRSNGIDIYKSGGQREHRVSVNEYANIFMRSKIALNFCWGWGNSIQAKGRIFEATLCGAMLLEADNPETSLWFEPMVDYIPFNDEKDLVKKAKYYIEHDSEREKIAESGYRKAKEKYNNNIFWNTIVNRILGKKYSNTNLRQ